MRSDAFGRAKGNGGFVNERLLDDLERWRQETFSWKVLLTAPLSSVCVCELNTKIHPSVASLVEIAKKKREVPTSSTIDTLR